MKRSFFCLLALAFLLACGCWGCSKDNSNGGFPTSSTTSQVATDALTKIAWLPNGDGVTIQFPGFGEGPNNEIVVAGGYEDQSLTDQPRFIVHDEVHFYDAVNPDGSLSLARTARLPKPVVRPQVVTIGQDLYVLGGFEVTTSQPVANDRVWRYERLTNSFLEVAVDPESSASSFAFSFNNTLCRLTPPYRPPQSPLRLGSIACLQPTGTWQLTPLSQEIPVSTAWTVFNDKLYLFGGFLLSGFSGTVTTLNQSVFEIDLDTGQVRVLLVPTLPRLDGVAFLTSFGDTVVLAGGESAFGSADLQKDIETFDGARITSRHDLLLRNRLTEAVASGNYVFGYDLASRAHCLFRRR